MVCLQAFLIFSLEFRIHNEKHFTAATDDNGKMNVRFKVPQDGALPARTLAAGVIARRTLPNGVLHRQAIPFLCKIK